MALVVRREKTGHTQARIDWDAHRSMPDDAQWAKDRATIMFQEYRMRAFQGVFHANPDYALWYGWSRMKQTLTEMKDMQSGFKAASH